MRSSPWLLPLRTLRPFRPLGGKFQNLARRAASGRELGEQAALGHGGHGDGRKAAPAVDAVAISTFSKKGPASVKGVAMAPRARRAGETGPPCLMPLACFASVAPSFAPPFSLSLSPLSFPFVGLRPACQERRTPTVSTRRTSSAMAVPSTTLALNGLAPARCLRVLRESCHSLNDCG